MQPSSELKSYHLFEQVQQLSVLRIAAPERKMVESNSQSEEQAEGRSLEQSGQQAEGLEQHICIHHLCMHCLLHRTQ